MYGFLFGVRGVNSPNWEILKDNVAGFVEISSEFGEQCTEQEVEQAAIQQSEKVLVLEGNDETLLIRV